MSCSLIHPIHIKALAIQYIRRGYYLKKGDLIMQETDRAGCAGAIASVLWSALCHAVQLGEPSLDLERELENFGFSDVDLHITAHDYAVIPPMRSVAVLALCSLMESQTTCYPDWNDSQPKLILDTIRNEATKELLGYTDAIRLFTYITLPPRTSQVTA
jgi:hypothetical protein